LNFCKCCSTFRSCHDVVVISMRRQRGRVTHCMCIRESAGNFQLKLAWAGTVSCNELSNTKRVVLVTWGTLSSSSNQSAGANMAWFSLNLDGLVTWPAASAYKSTKIAVFLLTCGLSTPVCRGCKEIGLLWAAAVRNMGRGTNFAIPGTLSPASSPPRVFALPPPQVVPTRPSANPSSSLPTARCRSPVVAADPYALLST
jgi:hypothetical protein